MTQQSSTQTLLERYHDGDSGALGELLALHYEWIQSQVRQRLNAGFRRDGDTGDYLHQVIVDTLRRAPRFIVSDEAHFRRLLLVLIRNSLLDGVRFMGAKRRDRSRERRLPTNESVLYLDLDPPKDTTDQQRPDDEAMKTEHLQLTRLAIELLPAHERRVVELREASGQSFAELAESCEESPETLRRRYGRGIRRLHEIMRSMIGKDLENAIAYAERHRQE